MVKADGWGEGNLALAALIGRRQLAGVCQLSAIIEVSSGNLVLAALIVRGKLACNAHQFYFCQLKFIYGIEQA